jgi:hypothetical protein
LGWKKTSEPDHHRRHSNSFATLTTNQVAGAVLSPPFDEKAVSLGYKKLLLGDLAIFLRRSIYPQAESAPTASAFAAPSPPS